MGLSHNCYIKHFSKLILSQKTKNVHKAVFCKRCFQHYQGKKKLVQLAEHQKNCKPNKPDMPEIDSIQLVLLY